MSDIQYDVLFVDDDANILKAIKRNLHGKYKIAVAESINEATKLLDSYQFPVVFSDMKMPAMNGADFLILVKEKNPDSIRVLLTGESDLSDAIKAINESDIYKILMKPCSPENLCSTIDSALKLYHAHALEEMIMDKSLKGFVYIILDLLNIISPEIFKRSIDITKIARSPKTNFKLNDSWSFEVACLLMYLGSIQYRLYKFEAIYGSENMVKVIRKSASLLSKIPKFEPVYQILNDLSDFYHKNTVIEQLDSDSKILKFLVDYHSMIHDSKRNKKLRHLYSLDVISQIPYFFGKIPAEAKLRSISVNEVNTGMKTVQDVTTKSGSILIFKDEIITEKHISTLMIFSSKEYLNEPFKVLES